MIRRTMFVLLSAALLLSVFSVADAQAQQAFDRQWGHSYSTQDWNRMYHYPYVYYPQNFWGTRLLSQQRGYVLSVSAGNANSGVPQAVAELLSRAPARPAIKEHQFFPMFCRRASHGREVLSGPPLHRRRVLGVADGVAALP